MVVAAAATKLGWVSMFTSAALVVSEAPQGGRLAQDGHAPLPPL